MGRGDQFEKPSFTVPMPAGVDWPFGARPVREYCKTCGRPLEFCECPPPKSKESA